MVILLNKNLVHTNSLVKTKLKHWKEKKDKIVFVPTYSLKINMIERKLHQIKLIKLPKECLKINIIRKLNKVLLTRVTIKI